MKTYPLDFSAMLPAALIGLTEEEAEEALRDTKYFSRVVERDGKSTQDIRTTEGHLWRINLSVSAGKVIKATMG